MLKTEDVLTRGVQQILPNKEGLSSLMAKRKIKLYQGFDPSAPSLHLGNFVGLMKLRQFQKLGHEVIFLVGDFTGMIGDPTDKTKARQQLTREKVLENAKAWKEQAGKIIDFGGDNPAKIVFNSEWSDKVSFKDLIEITSNMTVQQLIERDMFQERIKNKEPIYLHEFLYPIAQGYDSVVMDVDLEIGGNDQLFNMMAGRTLMKAIKNKDKYVLTMKLLVDKEGKKVGKTTGNALFLDSTPENFYAGIMSFPDEVIYLAFELLTEVDLNGIEEKIKNDPMTMKKMLAFEIVKFLWGESEALSSETEFFNRTKNNLITKPDAMFPEAGLTNIPNMATFISTATGPSGPVDSEEIGPDGPVSYIDQVSISQAKRWINEGSVAYIDQGTGQKTKISNNSTSPTEIGVKAGGVVKAGNKYIGISGAGANWSNKNSK